MANSYYSPKLNPKAGSNSSKQTTSEVGEGFNGVETDIDKLKERFQKPKKPLTDEDRRRREPPTNIRTSIKRLSDNSGQSREDSSSSSTLSLNQNFSRLERSSRNLSKTFSDLGSKLRKIVQRNDSGLPPFLKEIASSSKEDKKEQKRITDQREDLLRLPFSLKKDEKKKKDPSRAIVPFIREFQEHEFLPRKKEILALPDLTKSQGKNDDSFSYHESKSSKSLMSSMFEKASHTQTKSRSKESIPPKESPREKETHRRERARPLGGKSDAIGKFFKGIKQTLSGNHNNPIGSMTAIGKTIDLFTTGLTSKMGMIGKVIAGAVGVAIAANLAVFKVVGKSAQNYVNNIQRTSRWQGLSRSQYEGWKKQEERTGVSISGLQQPMNMYKMSQIPLAGDTAIGQGLIKLVGAKKAEDFHDKSKTSKDVYGDLIKLLSNKKNLLEYTGKNVQVFSRILSSMGIDGELQASIMSGRGATDVDAANRIGAAGSPTSKKEARNISRLGRHQNRLEEKSLGLRRALAGNLTLLDAEVRGVTKGIAAWRNALGSATRKGDTNTGGVKEAFSAIGKSLAGDSVAQHDTASGRLILRMKRDAKTEAKKKKDGLAQYKGNRSKNFHKNFFGFSAPNNPKEYYNKRNVSIGSKVQEGKISALNPESSIPFLTRVKKILDQTYRDPHRTAVNTYSRGKDHVMIVIKDDRTTTDESISVIERTSGKIEVSKKNFSSTWG